MIIIKVQGGLGNQLLQYSFGKLLKVMYEKDVAYDLSFFENENKYTKRPYLLDYFNVDVRVAIKAEIYNAKYPLGVFSKVSTFFSKLLNKFIFKKYNVGYNKKLLHILKEKDVTYLEGFWQSYRYYTPILKILNDEISLKNKSRELLLLQEEVTKSESVAVHIRRGDYITASSGLSVLEIGYYEKAVSCVEKKIHNPKYFIFSDDIEWVKKEMEYLFKDVVYVSSYELSDCEEFIVMKECQHAIIANSTFSWFSVLLSDRDDKVVIYPHDWKNKYLSKDNNICPQHWYKV